MRIVNLVAGLALLAISNSSSFAAYLTYQTHDNSAVSVYLVGEALNGNFDAIEFRATPLGSSTFLNPNQGLTAGVPRPPGNPFTYRSRFLDLDPADPDLPGLGKGWTIANPITTSSQVSFLGGLINGKISTASEPQGRLFLANLLISPGGGMGPAKIDITLYDEGIVVYSTVPEPSTLFLCALAPPRGVCCTQTTTVRRFTGQR
ncbi:hypothetical protein [Lacipirellula sp.]|uniref:hypothetical protein n=1 Tax=Lacipirellula sp. TaxID=2691419 RepID=UPI003D0DBD14